MLCNKGPLPNLISFWNVESNSFLICFAIGRKKVLHTLNQRHLNVMTGSSKLALNQTSFHRWKSGKCFSHPSSPPITHCFMDAVLQYIYLTLQFSIAQERFILYIKDIIEKTELPYSLLSAIQMNLTNVKWQTTWYSSVHRCAFKCTHISIKIYLPPLLEKISFLLTLGLKEVDLWRRTPPATCTNAILTSCPQRGESMGSNLLQTCPIFLVRNYSQTIC